MTKKIIFSLIYTFTVTLCIAQSKSEIDFIKQSTYYFNITNSNIVGEGSDVLKKSIGDSQFFIIGEEHFSAKVSEFTNAIIPILSNENYKYFAAEIGPNSASKISDIVKEDKSLYEFNTKINNLVGDIPVPFFDGVEDELFLQNAIAKGFDIWGIDQEYLTAHIFLIDEIYHLSLNKSELLTSYKKTKDYLIRETLKEKNDNKYKLFTELSQSSIVNEFFTNTESTNSKVQKIISDLKESWEIYRLREVKDIYTSYQKRVNMFKNNFIDYYSKSQQADPLPKVILKIGGVHAAKGKSPNNIFDIGNFIMELANFNRQKSTSVLVFPSASLNDNDSIENNIDKEDEIYLRPLINEANGRWVLIDLKKIDKYSWKHTIKYKSLKEYMHRYDYLIITPPSKSTTLNFKN